MPTQHGRKRHPARFNTRSTHSGFRANLMGGVRVPSVSAGALGSQERVGMPYDLARDGEQSQYPDIGPEVVDGSVHIRPQSITRPLFAETIIPPEVLGSLPSLPDDDYPQGSLVFLTTDEKLYRNTDGSTWSVAVDGEDIVANSITAGQIAAGAIGTTELAADAVIANVVNVGGTVVIDDDGITIIDGALTFVDSFGRSVLTGAGFGTTWLDYLVYGMYNAALTAGFTTDQAVDTVTLVGDADTEADYLASLSQELPYWVVETVTAGTVELTAAPAGFTTGTIYPRAMVLNNGEIRFFQDIPIHPGQDYSIILGWGYASALGTGSFTRTVGVEWRDSDHAAIDTMIEGGLVFSPGVGSVEVFQEKVIDTTAIGPAPENARYLRVAIEFERDMVIDTLVVLLTLIRAVPMRSVGDQIWADDDGTDLMTFTASTGNLAIRNTSDASLSSTGHGLTIGDDDGANLAFDTNEIMARNNEAAASLHLNADGGDVTVRFNGTGRIDLTENGNIRLHHGFLTLDDYTSLPGAADAGSVRLFADISGGKMRIRVRWPSGTTTLATEP